MLLRWMHSNTIWRLRRRSRRKNEAKKRIYITLECTLYDYCLDIDCMAWVFSLLDSTCVLSGEMDGGFPRKYSVPSHKYQRILSPSGVFSQPHRNLYWKRNKKKRRKKNRYWEKLDELVFFVVSSISVRKGEVRGYLFRPYWWKMAELKSLSVRESTRERFW